ncbi:flagellar biosynthesis anti-sigma factor FlgM [Fonticella tunisiensis]|nr:flagellar biosynthesis anti-sigma factor FlgM [Fonticella tunisiensis]
MIFSTINYIAELSGVNNTKPGSDKMRINNNDVNRIISIYNKNLRPDNSKEVKKNINDKVEISKTGKEIARYIDVAKNTDIKSNRAGEIKELIKQNKYNIDSEKLAESILKHIKERDF